MTTQSKRDPNPDHLLTSEKAARTSDRAQLGG